MPIAVTCGSCEAAFRVKEEHAGKGGKCPRCQALVDVPALAPPDKKTTPPPTPSSVDPSPHGVMQEILDAFEGNIPPVQTTAFYRVGIVVVACAMLVLPVLYIGLISGVAWLLYTHATWNLPGIGGMFSIWAILFFYLGPLVTLAILLFFLVKPIFARSSRKGRVRTLDFAEEPLLFALVTRVARAVGAPEPKRIDVDYQVNASASFDGILGGFLGGNLVLTIGMPLVAGLSIQQLAGVIAHELGHFTQGTGMRLTYVVRSINAWFARIVLERDDWDESLVRGCEDNEKLAIILYGARFCVWLTRMVLGMFMFISHALSCFLLRQMEYDADRWETRLAGTKDFAQTMRQQLLLDLVTTPAYTLAGQSWYGTSRLPNDMSALILALAATIPPKDFRKIEKKLKKNKTGFFDTHPSHGDRLASARREDTPGVFHLPGPATQLFRDFPRTARIVSKDYYRQVIGKGVKRATFVPVAVFLGTEPSAKAADSPEGIPLAASPFEESGS